MSGLDGKVVAITGAGSGIGAATGLLLAGRGRGWCSVPGRRRWVSLAAGRTTASKHGKVFHG